MINIISAMLFSISSNLDNIVIGIAYGIKKIKINLWSNFLISIITTLGTIISMYLGKLIISFLPTYIANILGAGIIIILGAYFFLQSLVNLFYENKNVKMVYLKSSDNMAEYAQMSDKNKSGNIETKEAFLVGLGLSFNNIGTGIAASVTGISIICTAIFTFIFSICFILAGTYIGNKIIGKFLGKFAPLISGVILIVIGVFELII